MVNTNFDRMALAEVYNVIIMLEKEKFDKIPIKLIKAIRYNMDEDYEVEWSELEAGNMREDTEKILSVLYTDYLATPEEKDIIMQLENLEHKNAYKMFAKNEEKTANAQESQLTIIKKEKWIVRVFNKIKNLFFK